jgi:hypothetical protein
MRTSKSSIKILETKDGIAKIMNPINEFNSRLHVRICHWQESQTCREYPNGNA